MAAIAEPVRPVRIVAKPKRFAPLNSFSCGRKGAPWERAANEWVRDLYLGRETDAQTVVVLEDAHGKLIGLCSFRPKPPPIPTGKFLGDAQCIHMLATDRLFRGARLEDGSRPGDALIRGALEQIKAACGGHMPYVWALVSPANDRSRALFARHGFRELAYSGKGDLTYVRAPHKRLPAIMLQSPRSLGQMTRSILGTMGRHKDAR